MWMFYPSLKLRNNALYYSKASVEKYRSHISLDIQILRKKNDESSIIDVQNMLLLQSVE